MRRAWTEASSSRLARRSKAARSGAWSCSSSECWAVQGRAGTRARVVTAAPGPDFASRSSFVLLDRASWDYCEDIVVIALFEESEAYMAEKKTEAGGTETPPA